MTLRRAFVLMLLTTVLAGVMLLVTVRAAIPRPPPAALEPAPPDHAPLTQRLVFVVVDGLRLDIATDRTLMPHFAAAMERHSSGEMTAGEVTMTSSAVLAYTTGQAGDLDQIVNNETGSKTQFNDLLSNAKKRGLVLAATGDVAWFRFHVGVWDYEHPDPPHVALTTDYNDEILAAARSFLTQKPAVNVMVLHFVTPDHQAHAYGVTSTAYRSHIHAFDAKLHRLLEVLPGDATVMVTSDHGANANGKHGSDAPIMRACPFYAYGPGIRPGWHPTELADQLDLAATMAYLLGVAAPAHSEGHVLAEWLDVPPEQRAQAACRSLERVERYGTAMIGSAERVREAVGEGCAPSAPPSARIASARAAVGRVVSEVHAVDFNESSDKWVVLLIVAALASLLGLAWLGLALRHAFVVAWPSLVTGVLLLGVALLFTRHTENLSSPFAKMVPVALTVLANLAILIMVLTLRRFGRLLDRHAPLVAAVTVGVLLTSYTSYTRAEAYVLVAVTVLVVLTRPLGRWLGVWPPAAASNAASSAWLLRCTVAVFLTAGLWKLAGGGSPFLPAVLLRPGIWQNGAVAVVALAYALAQLGRYRERKRVGVADGMLCVALALLTVVLSWHRSQLPSLLGVALWLVLPVAAVLAWRSGRRAAAEMCALACFALLARPHEIPIFVATVAIAQLVGSGIGTASSRHSDEGAGPRHAVVVGIAVFVFCLTYMQRIGVQSGVDFMSTDWLAGTFTATHVTYPRIAAAVVSKHALARGAVVLACLLPLSAAYRRQVATALIGFELMRSVSLTAMLFYCRRSFWTALRVLSELPHALVGVVVAAVALTVAVGLERRSKRRPSGALPADGGPEADRAQETAAAVTGRSRPAVATAR